MQSVQLLKVLPLLIYKKPCPLLDSSLTMSMGVPLHLLSLALPSNLRAEICLVAKNVERFSLNYL